MEMTRPRLPFSIALRGIFDVAGLLAENGTQEAFFRGQLRLALRRDLADQNVSRPYLCSDPARCPLPSGS